MAGTEKLNRILVIKHGALGDVVLAQSPFQAIRKAHPEAKITLLTTKPFAAFLEKSGLFDEVWIDSRPKIWQLGELVPLVRKLRGAKFDRVYDLQTSSRSNSYFRFFPRGAKPEWCGVAPGCSHPHTSPMRTKIHTIERHVDQLSVAGITDIPPADFTWAMTDIAKYELPRPFALLVPGGSAHRPEKRWPAQKFAELAVWLQQQGMTPVLIGGPAEAEAIALIRMACPAAVDLSSKTDFGDIAALGRDATLAVGNDTGPMHLIAAVGCASLVLFSAASDPHMSRPRGRKVNILREDDLANLPFEMVLNSLPLEGDEDQK
ncbi:MAG: lipopolysaccharide heptosyltransferase family protein [Alphaproteobacteria bacterium]|nr:MAG: lipopolysaccharide heptosyltransferase family protein [Alphaproteobacteria bacterium]